MRNEKQRGLRGEGGMKQGDGEGDGEQTEEGRRLRKFPKTATTNNQDDESLLLPPEISPPAAAASSVAASDSSSVERAGGQVDGGSRQWQASDRCKGCITKAHFPSLVVLFIKLFIDFHKYSSLKDIILYLYASVFLRK